MIEAVRREAPQAGRPHFRRAAERIIFEEVQFRRADRQVLAIPELRLDERRIGLVGDNEKGRAVLELMEARPSEAEAGRQAAGAEPPPPHPRLVFLPRPGSAGISAAEPPANGRARRLPDSS
ncbi:hypothetical protein ACVWXQ_003662 [Bradyrhizobium sp. S3.14.4]